MVFYGSLKPISHVRFVNYTGHYPNFCRGELTLEVDGKVYKFGGDGNSLPRFWQSGGFCSSTYVGEDEWEIYADQLPEELRPYVHEIDEVFNEFVPYGCCGGCL